MVRFMKAIALAARWIYANKEAAADLLAKEMELKREYARKGWEFYTEKGLWHPNGDRDSRRSRDRLADYRRADAGQRAGARTRPSTSIKVI